jgi:hypothetical protein
MLPVDSRPPLASEARAEITSRYRTPVAASNGSVSPAPKMSTVSGRSPSIRQAPSRVALRVVNVIFVVG